MPHRCISLLGYREQMRLEVFARPSSILLNDIRPIDRHLRERVHGYEHNSTVGIYLVLSIALINNMQNCINIFDQNQARV